MYAYIVQSVHLDHPVINEIRERLRVDVALDVLALNKLVPPAEEEVARNKLEPGREEVA